MRDQIFKAIKSQDILGILKLVREPKAYAAFAEVDVKGLTLLGVALAIKQTINDRDLIYASELAKIDVIITIIIEFSRQNLISKKMTKLGFLEQYLTKDQCEYYNKIFKTLSSDGKSLHIKGFILENQDLYKEISNYMAINQIDNPRENKFTQAILEFKCKKKNKLAGAAVFKDNVYSAEHLAYWYIVSIMLEDKIIYKKNKKTCLQHVFEYLPSLKKINPNRFTDFAIAIKTAKVFQIKPEELKKSEYMTPFFAVSTQESADAAMAELLSDEAKPATVKKCSTKAKKGSLKKKKIKGLAAASVTKTLKINANYISQISTAIKTNKLPEKIKTIFCLAEVISKIITPDQQSFFQEIYDSAENKFKNSSKALHYTTDLDMDSIIDFWNHSIKTMIEIVPPNNKKNSRILDYLASKILLKIESETDLLDYINKNFSDLGQVFFIKSTATRMLQVNLGLPLDTTKEYDLLLPEINASLPKDPKFHLHVGKLPFFNDSHHEFAVDYRQRTLLEYEGLFKNLQKICVNIRDFRLGEVEHDQLAENFYVVATTKYSIGKNFTKFMSDQANLKLITKAAVVYLRKYVCYIKDKPFKYFQENLQKLLFEIHPEMIQQLNMVFHAFSQKNWLDRGINAFPGFYLFLLQHLQVKNTSNTEYLQSLGFLASERSNANFLQSQMIKQDPATTSLPNAIKRSLGKILQLEP